MIQVGQRSLLVTGAGGKLGRRVVEILLDTGTGVVAGSRDPEKLSDLAARGAELRRVDFDEPSTLAAAFTEIDAALIISVVDTPHDPGLRLRQHRAAVEAAARAGVRHITYTSMQGPDADSPLPFAADHRGTEAAIRETGIPHTILRPNWYADIAFAWVPPMLASGTWLSAAGEGRAAHVWRDDLAGACAASLIAGGEAGRILDISGSQALSPREIVEAVNEVFGSDVLLRPVGQQELKAALAEAGLPGSQVEIFAAVDEHNRQGRADTGPDGFAALTGRQPRGLRDFLVANRDGLLAASRAS